MVPASVQRLLGCNVYISEGRNVQLIRRLEEVCRQHPSAVCLAHTFIDEPYNRTGLTLAANSVPELAATVHAVAKQALQCIDLSTHSAQHPRLGVLDHVSLHPLGPQASLSLAAQAAAAIGQQLSQPPLQLPVYYYGAAHPGRRRLAEIRRRLGYFKPTTSENWHGSLEQLQLSEFLPDAGPLSATAAAGVVTVGAVPWVTNYNVPLYTQDMAAAKAVARAVSTKGGGLPGVEAMALPHGPGVIEVATNLIAYSWCSSPTPRSDATHQAATAAAGSPSQADGGQCSQPDPQEPSSSSSSSSTSSSSSSSSSGQLGVQDSSWGSLTGAGPDEVAAAVAQEARRLGLPPPGPGYVTNKTPPQLLVYAAETLQQS